MFYSVAEHIMQISGEKLAETISFSPFTLNSTDFIKSTIDIEFNSKINDIEGKLIYECSLDIFDFAFFEDGSNYYLRFKKNDQTWFMKIYSLEDHFYALTNITENTNIHIIRFAIWTAFGISTLAKNTVSVHSSALLYNNKAILFLGESGTGKSTQSRLWLENIRHTELLNDDSPFVETSSQSLPLAWGSPWSGKTCCYKNENAPIAAFIRLTQASTNRIRRLTDLESIAALQPSLPPMFATSSHLSKHLYRCLSNMLYKTPVYQLDCLPNREAVELTFNTLLKDQRI